MARLQRRSCGFDQIEWDGRLVCPSCGPTNARVAAGTTEPSDGDFEMITHSEIPEDPPLGPDDAERAPAVILRCRGCRHEFRVGKECCMADGMPEVRVLARAA